MLKKDDLSALSCSCDFMLKVIIVWNFSGDKRHTVITGWEYLGIDDKERREQNLETITITPVSVTDKPKGFSKIYPVWTIQTTEKQPQMVHNLRMVRKLTHSLSLSHHNNYFRQETQYDINGNNNTLSLYSLQLNVSTLAQLQTSQKCAKQTDKTL